MGKKVYVGNLSYSVTSEELAQLFEPYGTVESADVITDRATGRSKGFGFVEMATDEEAQKAIEGLNGRDNAGRALTVSEARPREDRGDGPAVSEEMLAVGGAHGPPGARDKAC